jgi:ABC-type lipoprotein export system ATPase subunit
VNKAMVRTEGLSKTYQRGRVTALDGISMAVGRGEFCVILGHSGSGKTTLLNLIGALDRPTDGRVVVDDVDLSKVRNLSRLRAEKVGFVFQMYNLISSLDACHNVQVPMYGIKTSPKQRRERAMELLDLVGLKDRANHHPAMLSGGERQRVAIARALANHPPLVLVDEPTGNLDLRTGEQIIELLHGLSQKAGDTVVVATHDPRVASVADRTIQISNGRIVGGL